MNASRRPESAPADELPLLEPVSGPMARQRVERRWLGLPASFVLLCLGCAGAGAAIGLFATGSWAWGVVSVFVAVVLFAALAEGMRRGEAGPWTEQSSRLAADRRAQAATTAEVLRTRLETTLTRWRARSELDRVELDRTLLLQLLGEAVWRGDRTAQRDVRRRLKEMEEERERIEAELEERVARAEERIQQARLPVQDTIMVAPNEPNAPYPPPDEGNPPQPATIPEPYPPPDEGTPPTPAPDPGQADE